SKQSPVLLDSLNSWLQTFRNSDEFKSIYRKYYPSPNKK
ncbi:MAG: glutamine ABC transporter substrate-binding protein, partial [Bacteroides oleiciplenus]|nr:glutamine ABC transporter substrate-binding protein [Bacteroides oleiciplenus]